MQPLRFQPLLKQTLWGGNRIVPFKHIDSELTQVGESWEISSVPGHETIVSEGRYAGLKLSEVINQEHEKLVGRNNYLNFGNELPLLIKFIDAKLSLSIQVHPDDETARNQGHERGKNEMWYIMDSDPDASLLVGLKEKITPEQYTKLVEDDKIVDVLNRYPVKEGDCFYLPAGRIHSIGAGCFLAEIQQTSDVTYRIYDFKRKDKNGNYRELHTKQAAESIDYHVEADYQTHYTVKENARTPLVDCPFFHTSLHKINGSEQIDLSQLDSFLILIVTKGKGSLLDNEGNSQQLIAGDTLLVPATTSALSIEGNVNVLTSYVI